MYNKLFIFISLLLVISPIKNLAQLADSTKIQSIDEVTISAYRTNSNLGKIPQQLKVISKEEINSIPAKGLDEILKKSAAIDVLQYPGFNTVIGLRGFSPSGLGKTNTLILIDGIPAGTNNISTLNLENAKQLELLKGPYSAFFGSEAMAGVINIETLQSKDKISGTASVSYGSFKTHNIKVNVGGKINSKLNFDLFASNRAQNKNYTTGSYNLLKLRDEEKLIMEEKSYGKEYKNTQYEQYSAGARIGFQLAKDWEINLNQDYWLAKNIQDNGDFWGTYGATGKDIERWSQSLYIEGKAGRNALKLSPYYSIENTNYFNNVTSDNYQTSNYAYKTYGVVLQDALSLGNHRIIFGADNISKKFESKQWSNSEEQTSPYQPDYLNMATGIYVQANFNFLNDRLNTSFGGRYDNIMSKLFKTDFIESKDASETYNVFNPNFGIQYKLLESFKIHAAAGSAFVAPDAFKLAGDFTTPYSHFVGNPDLKPETSATYDFGIGFNNHKLGLNADITYFRTKHKDMVIYDYSTVEFTSFINAQEANMDGIEIELDYDFGALNNYKFSLKPYLSYTHMFNSKLTINDIENEMRYVRKNKASFGVTYKGNEGLSARINGRYIGQRYEDNFLYNLNWTTYERIPLLNETGEEIRPTLINEDVIQFADYLIFDLSASYTLKNNVGFGFSVDNLFDDNYSEKDAYYMSGRSFMGSISYKF